MNRTQIGAVSRMVDSIDHMIAALGDLSRDECRCRDSNYNNPEIKSKATANIQALDTASGGLVTALCSLNFILENERKSSK